MKKEDKIALIGIGLGFGLFWLLNRFVISKPANAGSSAPPRKQPKDEDLATAVSAFQEAIDNQEDASTLQALNASFASEYKIQIHQRSEDGTLVVTDMQGSTLATYDPNGEPPAEMQAPAA